MKNMIEQLLNGLDSQTINDINAKADNLSPKGQKLLKEQLTENKTKLSKLAKKQRPAKISAMIDALLPKYTKKELRQKKEKVDRRMAVLQIDKATNKVVAEHESVQAAHRATNISDGSICYCCLGKYGFKTAGGFKWAYKKDWTEPKEETKE